MSKDSLGDRMKKYYENRSRMYLTRRTPVILRLDGKAFHTFTKGCVKPFDEGLNTCMVHTTKFLMNNIQGAKLAYTQSDEISILVTDYDKLETDAWFDYNIQKMCSITSAFASVQFTHLYASVENLFTIKPAYFDCRAFNLPKEEVANYFLWRFNDWVRNSVSMLAQAHFSQKQLNCKNQSDMHDMLHSVGVNWADLHPKWKNGTFVYADEEDWVNIKETSFREKFINQFIGETE